MEEISLACPCELCSIPVNNARKRHSSAPDRLYKINSNVSSNYDDYYLPPSFCAPYEMTCYNNNLEFPWNDIKESWQSIKDLLFPTCDVKPILLNDQNANDAPTPTHFGAETKSQQQAADNYSQRSSEKRKRDHFNKENEVFLWRKDDFVEVEWDTNEDSDTGKNEAPPQNAKVTEILVLKPKWLQAQCKTVVFRDCHISLDPVELKSPETKNGNRKLPSPVNLNNEEKLEAQDGQQSSVYTKEQFSCDKCKEVFAQQYQLKIHTVISHTGKSPYNCKMCGTGFLLSASLHQHVLLEKCTEKRRKTS